MNSFYNKLKDIGASVGGFVLIIIIMFVIWVGAYLLIEGSAWLGDKLIPWLNRASGTTFAILILVLLPLSIFHKTKAFAGSAMVYSSLVFGLNLWFLGLLLTYTLWGPIAVIIGLFILGIGVVPIAILATLFNGLWAHLGSLFILIVLTFGVRLLGFHLVEKAEEHNLAIEADYEIEDEGIDLD